MLSTHVRAGMCAAFAILVSLLLSACGPIRFYLSEYDKLMPFTGDPAQLELIAHREIVIVSGVPPATLPKFRWPVGL